VHQNRRITFCEFVAQICGNSYGTVARAEASGMAMMSKKR